MREIRFKNYYWEFVLIGLCLVNLFTAFIPQVVIYLLILYSVLKRLPKESLAFCCLVFLGDINHAMFFLSFRIPMMSPLTILIGLYIMRKFLLNESYSLIKNGRLLLFIIVFMALSMILSGNTSVNLDKLIDVLVYGVLSYIAFSYLFYNRNKIDFYRLAVYCTIFSLFLLQLNTISNGYGTPNSLLDFGFYRMKVGTDMYTDLAQVGIAYATHYQFFGLICTYGLSLCMSFERMSQKSAIILLLLNLIAIGYTGARQFLIILFLLFAFFMLFSKGNIFGKILIATMGCLIISLLLFNSILNEYFTVLSDRGVLEGSGRLGLVDVAVDMFKNNPLIGVGFGGYNFWGNYDAYPHNIILEILAEMGIVGLLFIVLSVLYYFRQIYVFFSKKYDIYLCFLLIPLIARAMISGSLADNIVIFSAINAMYFYSIILKQHHQQFSFA